MFLVLFVLINNANVITLNALQITLAGFNANLSWHTPVSIQLDAKRVR